MKSKLSGCVIDFNPSFSLKLKDEIDSGSFSTIYSTQDPRYVVKMINASDQKSLASYKNERFAFNTIPRHENIVFCPAYNDGIYLKGINYCCLVLENCSKGSLIHMIVDQKITFQEHQIFRILFEVICGLHQMHSLSRPIAHRDLKGENILLGPDGHFKLTDFGSISTRRIQNINSENRDDIQEDIDKNTTPTIRAPEQCDLYSGAPISEKVDIWGVGCLLYILCFHKQPFESRLATVNCSYFMPDSCQYSQTLLSLFPMIFKVDPRERPSAIQLLSFFEENTKRSLTNFVSSIGTLNENANYSGKHQRTSSIPSGYAPSNNQSFENNRPVHYDSIRSHYATTHVDRVRAPFIDVIQKHIAKLTTKTEGWMLSSIEETPKPPNQIYAHYLVVKAWKKPQKIQKFYSLLYKKYIKNPESTIITLKTLITLHTYFRKGPIDVYLIRDSPSARSILFNLNQTWKIIFEKGAISSKDIARNTYTTGLILEYSEIMLRKHDLHLKYQRTFQGNYSLEPFFLMPVEENSPILARVIEDLLKFLYDLTNFHSMLLLENNLWLIQCSIASSILDEEYCLISVLAHLIATFKHATNFVAVTENNKTSIEETVKKFEERFSHEYEKASIFFETCKELDEFHQQRGIIPSLQPDVIQEIKRIPILLGKRREDFHISRFLNSQITICRLSLPTSYNETAQNISYSIC